MSKLKIVKLLHYGLDEDSKINEYMSAKGGSAANAIRAMIRSFDLEKNLKDEALDVQSEQLVNEIKDVKLVDLPEDSSPAELDFSIDDLLD